MNTKLDLMEVQYELEREAVEQGAARYMKQRDFGETETQPGLKLLKAALEPMIKAIDAWVAEADSGNGGRNYSVVKFIKQFETEQVAYLTARHVINAMAQRWTLQNMAITLAKSFEEAINYDRLKQENPKMYGKFIDRIKKVSGTGRKVIFLKKQLKYAGLAEIKWDIKTRSRLGTTLIQMFINETGLAELQKVDKESPYYITYTEATRKYLEESHERCSLLFPIYTPMVIPPKKWTTPFNGGYLTHKLPLVKSKNRAYMDELKNWEMPQVYRAINALQETPWRVNKAVLNVLREVWDGGGNLGKLPSRENLPIPAYPADYDTMPEEQRNAFNKKVSQVIEDNLRLRSKRIGMFNRLAVAERYSEFDQFYFPHTLDWRGRAYPVSGYMHPQSDDSGKALLEFYEGKPLGPNGPYWLAVHLANTYGVDKVSFEERVQWVEANHDRILESAMNPLDGSRWWADADSPWMFLAACFEWLGYTMQGESYVSHIPVSWDGSCNGLQNFSAMLRDAKGGAATNLVPADKPADIYTEVATRAQAKVDADAAAGNAEAKVWVGKVTRKWAKRNTMTMPYGSGKYGFRTQLQEELRKYYLDNGHRYLDGSDDFHASCYLAEVMYDSISATVVAARQAMDWLQSVARAAAKADMPIWWTTPAGFLVLQDYKVQVGDEVDFEFMGKRIRMVVNVETENLDRRKQGQGISPNYVHSMDASHMMLTVNRCLDMGITSFAMIHDSYGTHACDAEELSQTLRRVFIDQYAGNVLDDFRKELMQQLPEEAAEELAEVPPMGTLDLEGVMHSEYFFA